MRWSTVLSLSTSVRVPWSKIGIGQRNWKFPAMEFSKISQDNLTIVLKALAPYLPKSNVKSNDHNCDKAPLTQ